MASYGEKLKNSNIFSGMIYSACKMGSWCFSYASRKMFYTTCPNQQEFLMFFSTSGCLEYMFSPEVDTSKPVFLSDTIGMLWVADYLYDEDGRPNLVMVIGPVFSSESSVRGIEDSLRSLNFSHQVRKNMIQILQKVPIVPVDMMHQYAAMLHYTVTGEIAMAHDFQFQHSIQKDLESEMTYASVGRVNMERQRMTEETILQMIREGNPDCTRLMQERGKFSRPDDYRLELSQRENKNTMVIFAALCSRAAMEGGLSPKIAKDLEIKYITMTEQAKTVTELVNIREKMMEEFASRVHQCRNHLEVSRVVQECCEYIQSNLLKPLELSDIAKEVGYTEYYLTKKFNKEMGVRLLDYIKDSRVELAKIWLLTTQKSVQEISDQMYFGSRNYFTKVFREKVGVTPAAYREQMAAGQAMGKTERNEENEAEKGC